MIKSRYVLLNVLIFNFYSAYASVQERDTTVAMNPTVPQFTISYRSSYCQYICSVTWNKGSNFVDTTITPCAQDELELKLMACDKITVHNFGKKVDWDKLDRTSIAAILLNKKTWKTPRVYISNVPQYGNHLIVIPPHGGKANIAYQYVPSSRFASDLIRREIECFDAEGNKIVDAIVDTPLSQVKFQA